MKKPRAGFTIVELLIVIVVIAILAAIAVVAYSGLQQRARNNSKISAATQIAKLFDANTISSGKHVPGAPVCLPIGNADSNSDGMPDCGAIDAATVRSEKVSTNEFLTQNKLTNIKFPAQPISGTDGGRAAGIQITYNSGNLGMNGISQPYFLYFWLEGSNQDCTSTYSIDIDGTRDDLYKIVPGRNYSTSNGLTTCAYTLKSESGI